MTLRFGLIASALCAPAWLHAQNNQTKMLQNVGAITNANAMHIHTMPKSCKGEADRVYGKQDGVYYACVGEKNVCSKGTSLGEKIPPELIASFDASMAEFEAKHAEFKTRQAIRELPTTPAPLRNRPIPTRTR